jgi:hypothetical protein
MRVDDAYLNRAVEFIDHLTLSMVYEVFPRNPTPRTKDGVG